MVEVPFRKSWLVASPVLIIAIIPLFANWHPSTKAGETDTRDFAHDILNSVEPYGVLITVGDNDTFPIWYAQEVEGIRRDVLLVNTSLANTDWYPRQLIRRPVFDYDKEKGPAIYRDRDWPKPTRSPLNMTLDEVDEVPLVDLLPGPQVFTVEGSGLQARINKREFWKADYVVLRLIQDSFTDNRPVYFSRTSGGYGRELGLDQYLLTQGLAQKLVYNMPANPGQDTVRMEGAWLDVNRTRALWDSVYLAKASLLRKNKWIDIPSQGIPYLYFATGVALGSSLQVLGDTASARRVLLESADLYDAVKLEKGIGGPGVAEMVRKLAADLSSGGEPPIPLDPPPAGGTDAAAAAGRGGTRDSG